MVGIAIGPDGDRLRARQKPDAVAVISGRRQTDWCRKNGLKLRQEVV
jgi:hypothetical protein